MPADGGAGGTEERVPHPPLDEEDARELAAAIRVRLLRDTTRGKTAGYRSGLFQLRLRGNPQGGRFDPVRIHDLPLRPYDSAPGDQRGRLRIGDVVLRLNDRRIHTFRTLDTILDYIKKNGRMLELYISATRRGEEALATPRRIRNASLPHHLQNLAIQALASVYKRPCVTNDERRLAAASGSSWGSARSCCTLFALGPGGWYDTLEVRVRKLFSVHAPRQHYLDGAGGGGGGGVEAGGARRRLAHQPMGFGQPAMAPQLQGGGGHEPRRLSVGGRHQRLFKKDAPAVGGGFGAPGGNGLRSLIRHASSDQPSRFNDGGGGQLGDMLRQGDPMWLEREVLWLELLSVKAGCRHETAPMALTSSASSFAVDLREDVLMPVLPFGDQLKVPAPHTKHTHARAFHSQLRAAPSRALSAPRSAGRIKVWQAAARERQRQRRRACLWQIERARGARCALARGRRAMCAALGADTLCPPMPVCHVYGRRLARARSMCHSWR